MHKFLETEVSTYLISDKVKPCGECGKETNLLDVYSEGYFCSDECMSVFYKCLTNRVRDIEE